MTIPWYKSKQFWFNVLAVVVTIAAAYGFDQFQSDPRVLIITQLAIAVINVVLRFAIPSVGGAPGAPPRARTGTVSRAAPYTLGGSGYRRPVEGPDPRRQNQIAAAVFAAGTAAATVLLLT